MTLYRYNVTRIRAAACCPRIHYFDAAEQRRKGLTNRPLTRIWTEGDTAAGGGRLFHTVVERFNAEGARNAAVLDVLTRSKTDAELHRGLMRFVNTHCIDHDTLRDKSVALRETFVGALSDYLAEVARMLSHAVASGVPPVTVAERAFGDQRKRVDATFHVADADGVHVTGALDYVYQDPASGEHRIVDYKLTPAIHPNKDVTQVMVYALIHHHQHRTEPDAVVRYLYPKHQTVERKWQDVYSDRAKVYDLLASMTGWENYDEEKGTGLKPVGDLTYCGTCKWSGDCERRLGPKAEGGWEHRWQSLSGSVSGRADPESVAFNPARVIPDDQLVEGPLPDHGVHCRHDGPSEIEFADTVQVGSVQVRPASLASAASTPSPKHNAQEVPASPDGARLELGATTALVAQAVSVAPGALNTHVAVVGAAGSGKTWMAKVLAEEAILAGIPVLAIDPQGDLVQFLRLRAESEVPAESLDRYRRYRDVVEPRVFTPGSSHATRLSLDPIRLPSAEDLARISDPLRREEEHQAMVSAVANNLVALCRAGGELDSQRTFLFQLLLAMKGERMLSLSRIIDGIQEPDSFGLDDADRIVKKAEREKLGRKLQAFVRGPAAALFEGGAPLDLDQLRTPSARGKVPLNVIYLNALADDDQKHFFVATLASELYRWMVTSLDGAGGKPNLLFYVDEARDYIPAGGKKPPAKESLIRLFTQGRKYGVGCLLCTQSPRQVDYNVFGNCSTKVIGRMEASQDIDRIVEWFSTSGAVPPWIAHRKGAERGTFVARWPEMPNALSGVPFRSRVLFSAHEGAWSPDRLEREMRAT